MNSTETDALDQTPPGDPGTDPQAPLDPAPPAALASDNGGRPARLLVPALVAGIVASVAAGLLGEALNETFAVPEHLRGSLELSAALAKAQSVANIQNATLLNGLLGAILSVALGTAGGWARSSPRAGAVGAVVGALASAGAGAGLTRLLAPVLEQRIVVAPDDLLIPLLIHVAIGGALGAGAGLAFGIGLASGRRTVVLAAIGGLVGAAIGAALYAVLGVLAFPLAHTDQLVPSTATARLLGLACVTVATALGTALFVRESVGPPQRLRRAEALAP